VFNSLNNKYLTSNSLVISYYKIIDLFCITDEFCKKFEKTTASIIIGNKPKRKPRMYSSEVITIYYLFRLSGFRYFKHFYIFYVQKHIPEEFQQIVSYNRFIELMQSALLPMTMFAKTCCLEYCKGISFVVQYLLEFETLKSNQLTLY